MFKRLFPALVALFVTFPFVHRPQSSATEPSDTQKHSPKKPSGNNQTQSEQTPFAPAANPSPSPFGKKPVEEQTSTNNQQQYDPRSDCLYRIYLGATVIGVVGAFIGLFLLIRQTGANIKAAEAARDSADAAKDSAEALVNGGRAWVLVKRTGSPEKWYAPDNPGYFPGMVFEFQVYGGTPATIIKAPFRLIPVAAKPGVNPPEPDLPPIPDYRENSNPELPEGRRVVPPNGTFEVRLSLDPPVLNEKQWVELTDSETIMCAYGFIEYIDTFGRNRITRVCYVYAFGWGGVMKSPDGTVLNPPGFRIGGPAAYNEVT